MSTLDNLAEKLEAAEARVGDVTTKLEGLADLQGTLDDSNAGLRSASDKVGSVAVGVESTVTTLRDALTSFREVVEVLRRSDPARLFEGQTRVEGLLKEAQQHITQIGQSLPDLKQKTSEVQDDIGKLQADVSALGVQMDSLVQTTVSEAEGRLRVDIEVVSKSVRIGKQLSAIAVIGVVSAVLLLLMK